MTARYPTAPGWWWLDRRPVEIFVGDDGALHAHLDPRGESYVPVADITTDWGGPCIPPQPAPSGGEGDVWAELIGAETDPALRALYIQRRGVGIDRYGTPLRRGNGRDTYRDLREELLDATAYAQALHRPSMVEQLRWLLLDIDCQRDPVDAVAASLAEMGDLDPHTLRAP